MKKIDNEDLGAGLVILLIGVPIGITVFLFKWKIIDVEQISRFFGNLLR